MDSDCAYFSDKQEDDDDQVEDQTLNFNVQSHDQLPQRQQQDESDDEYKDFKKQDIEIDDMDQIIDLNDDEYDQDADMLVENDPYLQSNMDYMYSEETQSIQEQEDVELDRQFRESIKQREKDFYGDDDIEATADVSSAIREVDNELEDDSHEDFLAVEVTNNMLEKSQAKKKTSLHEKQ